jgi:hypothetical protein
MPIFAAGEAKSPSALRCGLIFAIGLSLPLTAAAQTAGEPDRLFQDSELIDVRIAAPFSTIMDERNSDEEYDGKLQYTGDAGETVEVDVGIRSRGRFRLRKRICEFAPLRLNFRKSQTEGSLFHHQDKVKLVTHCEDDSDRYQQAVVREFVVYRILNELTDLSFRARLMRVTYVDTDGGHRDRIRYGFIVEEDRRLAKRADLKVMDMVSTWPGGLHPEYTNLVSLFHFLIGNTDYSPVMGAEGACCHNQVLMGRTGELLRSVPYDFDQAGLVNARHARPNPRFRLNNVRQRLYRGYCENNRYLDATIRHFQDKRDAILGVVREQRELTDKDRKSISSYIERFYETVGSPRQVERQLLKKCI